MKKNEQKKVRIILEQECYLPDEYSYSNYTHQLQGVSAKAKANAAQGLPEMIEKINIYDESRIEIVRRFKFSGK